MSRRIVSAIALGLLVVAGLLPAGPGVLGARAAIPQPKVVIIVGATHGATPGYIEDANDAYAEAVRYTSNVVRVYSPNATWSAVRSAIQGANIVLYLGHGNGYPSPYTSSLMRDRQNGFGLNLTAGNGHYNNKYYGEQYIADYVRLAPNAVVLLSHLCYASGNSEPGHAEPSVSTARKRIDNYGAGFIAAGAKAVIAERNSNPAEWIRLLFTTRQTVVQAWQAHSRFNGNVASWASTRSSGFTSYSDPNTSTSGFYRSVVGKPTLTTVDVTGGAFAGTDVDPDDFVVPGAASAGDGGADLYADPWLDGASASGDGATGGAVETLAAGARVRVLDEHAPLADGRRVLEVETLDGATSGYTADDGLIPRDSTSPVMAGFSGGQWFSPNGDGYLDTLVVDGWFSELVDWKFRVKNAAGTLVLDRAGSGEDLDLSWDGRSGGTPVPDGTYTWWVSASDDWGNAPYIDSGALVIDRRPEMRLAGSDRYATSAAISRASFATGVSVAYVATGLSFPDALAGAAVAGRAGAPVLLVTPTAIPAATATELTRLAPKRIVVLGGTGAVSAAVLEALKAYTTGTVSRIAGPDRYATAAAISASAFAPGVPAAYVATGLSFPDALAGAAAAAKVGGPVLLTDPLALPPATAAELARLGPQRIVVLGGTGAVSAAVVEALAAYTSGSVTRIAGADRYATAAAISAATFSPDAPAAYVATGTNFPDALAGAAAAGAKGGPVLLVSRDTIPTAVRAELTRLGPTTIYVLGASAVISDAVKEALRAYQAD